MKRLMLIITIILVAIGGVVVFLNCSESGVYRNFKAEMQEREDKTAEAAGLCTADEINRLPACLKDFCEFIGLAGTPKYNITHCLFRQADFEFNEKKGVSIRMDYDLWIFADCPHREAFCKSAIMGIPFEGVDYFDTTTRSGGMKGYIAKHFQLFDQKAPNMERTMYLTLLAENAMLNPSFLLSDFIEYEDVDSVSCRAAISFNGVCGEGVFRFDKENGVLKFESQQRQAEELEDGTVRYIGWRCEGGNFHSGNEFKVPSFCKVTKIFPDREVVYFDAKDYELELKK